MRVLKFRAWDKHKKVMIYSGMAFELKCLEYPAKYGEDNKWGSDTIGFLNTNEKYFDVMQYTGLKDKHGKDIYEGDIIKNNSGRICKVEWHEYSGSWDFIALNNEGNSLGYSGNKNSFFLEIIGNIHETKL